MRFFSSIRLRIVFSVLIVVAVCIFGLISLSPRKAHAANGGEVYPAAITEFPIVTKNSWPEGITTGPDHNLWFAEYNSNKIGRITPGGSVTEFPLLTANSAPTGITAGPDGNVWFVERSGDKIGRITPSGVITEFPQTYTSVGPESIVAGPDGNLWFADYGGWIGRITPKGVVTEFPLPSSSINPGSITVGPDGNLWFTSISEVGRITTSGVITNFKLNSPYGFPGGIATGPDGNLWFTEYNSSGSAIGQITPKGVVTDFPIPYITYTDRTTWPVTPASIIAGPDGNLWFTSDAQALGRITPTGVVTEFVSLNASSFGGGIDPSGITVGPDGNVWFADDYSRNQIGYLAVGGSKLPTPTSVPKPSPTATPLPIAAPYLSEYLQASDAAYGLDRGNFTPPSGMRELIRSGNLADGFEAVALLDSKNNIIIANEGSLQFKGVPNGYTWNSGAADLKVWKDQLNVPALSDAINFAGKVLSAYYGKPGYGEIYVTGHSLGGIEAEAEAKAWSNIAGGATFGATGLPGDTTAGGPATLINYVRYGDPVGNYASDKVNALYDQTEGLMYHYGQVKMVGATVDASNLQTAVTHKDVLLELPPSSPNSSIIANFAADYLEISALSNVAVNVPDHLLARYALDLIGTSTSPLNLDSVDGLMLMYDLQLGSIGFSNLNSATVQSDGTLNSPDVIITDSVSTGQITVNETRVVKVATGTMNTGITTLYLSSTGLITSEKFVSSDGSVYVTTMNAAEVPLTIAVNTNTGGSYLIGYDPANKQLWSDYTNFYQARNQKGLLTESIYNWRAGGSQVQLFTNLPKGAHKQIKNYSGPNGTGKLLSTQLK